MNITKKLQDAVNKQINKEFSSSYLYLSMASYFKEQNLNGFAHWMKTQAGEEWQHGMKLYNYLIERGGKVVLPAIGAPQASWRSVTAVFEESYKHEQHVTQLINGLYELATKEKDHATAVFLQWFVSEQVEEEATVQDILQKLKLAGEKGPGLFMLDKELGAVKEG